MADRKPGVAVVIERQDAGDLASHRLHVPGVVHLPVHAAAVLAQDDARELAEAVDAERQAKQVGTALVPLAGPEAEARGGPQREGAARHDREGARRHARRFWRSRPGDTHAEAVAVPEAGVE